VIDTLTHTAHAAARETVTVTILGQHPVLGFVTDAAKIVLGAVLALGASWWMESRRRAEDDKRARGPFKKKLETETHLVLVELLRLVESLEQPRDQSQPQSVLGNLKPSLESLDRMQDRLYLLRNQATEDELNAWTARLRITVEQATRADLNQFLFNVASPNPQRPEYRRRFMELQQEGNRLLDSIRKLD